MEAACGGPLRREAGVFREWKLQGLVDRSGRIAGDVVGSNEIEVSGFEGNLVGEGACPGVDEADSKLDLVVLDPCRERDKLKGAKVEVPGRGGPVEGEVAGFFFCGRADEQGREGQKESRCQ